MTGIDIAIHRIRKHFAESLWLGVANKHFYSIAYRNQKRDKSGIIPEVFVSGNEYKEVLFDDNLNVLCFFDLDDETTDIDKVSKRNIKAIFAINLKNCYPAISYRAESEAERDIYKAARKAQSIATPLTMVHGLGAYGDLYTDQLKAYNMQPYYTLALIMEAKVNLGCDMADQIGYPDPIII